jgi:hypothetical protein
MPHNRAAKTGCQGKNDASHNFNIPYDKFDHLKQTTFDSRQLDSKPPLKLIH